MDIEAVANGYGSKRTCSTNVKLKLVASRVDPSRKFLKEIINRCIVKITICTLLQFLKALLHQLGTIPYDVKIFNNLVHYAVHKHIRLGQTASPLLNSLCIFNIEIFLFLKCKKSLCMLQTTSSFIVMGFFWNLLHFLRNSLTLSLSDAQLLLSWRAQFGHKRIHNSLKMAAASGVSLCLGENPMLATPCINNLCATLRSCYISSLHIPFKEQFGHKSQFLAKHLYPSVSHPLCGVPTFHFSRSYKNYNH